MAYLEIDYLLPLALVIAGLVGVMIVRAVARYAEHRAKARTRALLDAHRRDTTRET